MAKSRCPLSLVLIFLILGAYSLLATDPFWRYHPIGHEEEIKDVRDIFKLNDNLVLITESPVFYSEDNGYTWEKADVAGGYYVYLKDMIVRFSKDPIAHSPMNPVSSKDGIVWNSVEGVPKERPLSVYYNEDTVVIKAIDMTNNWIYYSNGSWINEDNKNITHYVLQRGDNIIKVEYERTVGENNYLTVSKSKIFKLNNNGIWEYKSTFNLGFSDILLNEGRFLVTYLGLPFAASDDLINWEFSTPAKTGPSKIVVDSGYFHHLFYSAAQPDLPVYYFHYRSKDGVEFEAVVENVTEKPEYFPINAPTMVDTTPEILYGANEKIKVQVIQKAGENTSIQYQLNNTSWKEFSWTNFPNNQPSNIKFQKLINFNDSFFLITKDEGKLYYYSLNEGFLIKVDNPVASGSYFDRIELSWDKVEGAAKYRIDCIAHYNLTSGRFEVVSTEKYIIAYVNDNNYTDFSIDSGRIKIYKIIPINSNNVEGISSIPIEGVALPFMLYSFPGPTLLINPITNPKLQGSYIYIPRSEIPRLNFINYKYSISESFIVGRHSVIGICIADHYPWLWSDAMGLVYSYPDPSTVDHIDSHPHFKAHFLFVTNIGWMWSHEDIFPFVFDFTSEKWVWISPTEGRPWFQLDEDGAWHEVTNPVFTY